MKLRIHSSIWVPSSRLKLLHTLKVAQVPSVIIHSNSRSGLRSIHEKQGRETNEKEGQIPGRSNSTRSSYYSFLFFLSRFMYIHVQWSSIVTTSSIRLTRYIRNILVKPRNTLPRNKRGSKVDSRVGKQA